MRKKHRSKIGCKLDTNETQIMESYLQNIVRITYPVFIEIYTTIFTH